MKTVALIEALDLTEAQIDLENRTVRQTLIRAGKSLNKRLYTDKVLETAAPLFNGAKAFTDHPTRAEMKERSERSVRQISGWFTDTVFENGALVATRHFTNTEAGRDSWSLVEQIVTGKAPASLMGASINALGRGRVEKIDGEDVMVIESIDHVVSCDDVTTPAAAGGWQRLVASDSDDMTSHLLKLVDYQEWLESHPDYVERLKKEWKTIRLEEETKRVLAEADEKVKAAETKAVDAQQALHEAQASLTDLTQAHEATVTELATARRALAIEQALRRANLPALYEGDLRDRLLKCDPSEWAGVIETEQRKARRTGDKIPVTGAPVVESAPPAQPAVTPSVVSLYPQDNETADEWRARIARMKPQATLQ